MSADEPGGPRESMNAMRSMPAYQLDGDDWASVTAGKLVDILCDHIDGRLGIPGYLPVGLTDPIEQYARDSCQASPSMSLNLMLPAAYASFGALGGGGWWVQWLGRQTRQMCPVTMQTIGLASSGSGKSTTHRALSRWMSPSIAAGEKATADAVSRWAEVAKKAAVDSLNADNDDIPAGDAEEMQAWKRARQAAFKEIEAIDGGVTRGLLTVFQDSTAEALVSFAIEHGGSPFVRSAEQDILDNLVRYSSRGAGASLTWVTDGWDGAEYRRARRGTGVEATSALVLSMSLLTQTESFFKSVGEEGGEAWLEKGLLGRVLVGLAPESSLESDVSADLALREGKVGEVPVDALVGAASWFAELGAEARAARLLEDRLRKVAPAESGYVKRALQAAQGPGVLPRAVSLSGPVAGTVGRVVRISAEDAGRLEDLHTWLMRVVGHVFRGRDRVINPVLSRVSYHLARLVAVRECAMRAVDGTLESWSDSEADGGEGGVISRDILVDTAVRVLPWILEMHLSVLGGVLRASMSERVRQELVASNGRDVSLVGMVAHVVRTEGVVFPCPVSVVAKAVARGNGKDYYDAVIQMFRDAYEGKGNVEEVSRYFQMAMGVKGEDGLILLASNFNPDIGVRMVG